MAFHGAYKGPCHEADLTEEILTFSRIDGLLLGRWSANEVSAIKVRLVAVPGSGHSVKITGMVDIHAPELACFIPTFV